MAIRLHSPEHAEAGGPEMLNIFVRLAKGAFEGVVTYNTFLSLATCGNDDVMNMPPPLLSWNFMRAVFKEKEARALLPHYLQCEICEWMEETCRSIGESHCPSEHAAQQVLHRFTLQLHSWGIPLSSDILKAQQRLIKYTIQPMPQCSPAPHPEESEEQFSTTATEVL
ncbi:MAG: hypothetical protein EA401_13240 [Planctomycetota bacterium]|nr:MAG: hypothetical protein EA401_13240 [Planctomycetota bacterium]